jgi:hypothetical protein
MLDILTILVFPMPALRRAPSKAFRGVKPSEAPETIKYCVGVLMITVVLHYLLSGRGRTGFVVYFLLRTKEVS